MYLQSSVMVLLLADLVYPLSVRLLIVVMAWETVGTINVSTQEYTCLNLQNISTLNALMGIYAHTLLYLRHRCSSVDNV